MPGEVGITAPDDTTWALMGYLGQFAAGIVAPLVVYFARKDRSPFVRFHGAQALNLTLTYTIVMFAAIMIAVAAAIGGLGAGGLAIGILLCFVFAIVHVVFLVIASIRASRRELYKVPGIICWPMVR
jgi:uncharacterized Tic20 family protein